MSTIGGSQSFWQQDQSYWSNQSGWASSISATNAVNNAMFSAETTLGKGMSAIANGQALTRTNNQIKSGIQDYIKAAPGRRRGRQPRPGCRRNRDVNEGGFGFKHPFVTRHSAERLGLCDRREEYDGLYLDRQRYDRRPDQYAQYQPARQCAGDGLDQQPGPTGHHQQEHHRPDQHQRRLCLESRLCRRQSELQADPSHEPAASTTTSSSASSSSSTTIKGTGASVPSAFTLSAGAAVTLLTSSGAGGSLVDMLA